MLKKVVLVSEISNLSDARYCAGMGVGYLSFELDKTHPSHIGFEKIVEIKNWLIGPQIGGRVEHWNDDIPFEELCLDFIIITKTADLEKAKAKAQQVVLETCNDIIDLKCLQEFDHLILHQEPGPDIQELGHPSIFYSFEIDARNWGKVVSENNFAQLVLKGKHEERPGFSQYGQLMEVLEALEDE